MGQVLHNCATTTHAVRTAIQRSKAPIAEIAERHGLNRKTVMKWRGRTFIHDVAMGPKTQMSTVLTAEGEAMAVACRRHTLLPLDDCLYALQASIPHLTRSSLHRLFQLQDISRLPTEEGDKVGRKTFKAYPIGYVHLDIAEVRAEQGKHTLRAMKENGRQGFWNGARAPIGYRIVAAEQRGAKIKKTLEIDPLQAETVRTIHRWALTGDGAQGPMGLKTIATRLNDQNVRTRDEGRWGISAVHQILTRTTYMGGRAQR